MSLSVGLIDTLQTGTPNALENRPVMSTWLRNLKSIPEEEADEKKNQFLRLGKCCICMRILGSEPFEGWCCM